MAARRADAAGWLIRIELEGEGPAPPELAFCIAACDDEGEALEAVYEEFGARGLVRAAVGRATVGKLDLSPGAVWKL